MTAPTLYLVRHGDAVSKAEDPVRPLSSPGREQAERMAAWAHSRGLRPLRVLHSGKARAEQTARILGERLEPPEGVHAVAHLNPGDDPAHHAETANATTGSLALVGHLPYMSRLTSLLLCGHPDAATFDFDAAGVACLRRDDSGTWTLAWLVGPGLLGATD